MTVYVDGNPKTKKALKEAVAAGKELYVFPAGLGPDLSTTSGKVAVSGPQYPKPHSWYAQVEIENGLIKKVVS